MIATGILCRRTIPPGAPAPPPLTLPAAPPHPSLPLLQYVEAYVFKVFLQEGRLATSSELLLAEPEE